MMAVMGTAPHEKRLFLEGTELAHQAAVDQVWKRVHPSVLQNLTLRRRSEKPDKQVERQNCADLKGIRKRTKTKQ